MSDSDPATTFGYVSRELGRRRLAFLCVRESHDRPALGPSLKQTFGGVYIANEAFSLETAEAALTEGRADAIAWGKLFIANPDLPERLRTRAALNKPNSDTFYSAGPQGYTDYPTLSHG